MGYLYISQQGTTVGISGNRLEIRYKNEIVDSIPIESIEIIEVFGNIQITTQCIARCLREGINIIFFSQNGSYFGRLISTCHINATRQRKQAILTTDKIFSLSMCKNILSAKIHNQIIIARRYARTNKNQDISIYLKHMIVAQNAIYKSESINQAIGHEGFAAKQYFKCLSTLIEPAFSFNGRSKRPPKDPFNSLISFGYALLLNEIYGKIEAKGLNPYWGFIHQDHEKHPTLASDLMEEWRAVIVDSLCMSCINGREIKIDEFSKDPINGGVYLNKEAIKEFITKFDKKLNTQTKYNPRNKQAISFRRSIDFQVSSLTKAIDKGEPAYYEPIRIR